MVKIVQGDCRAAMKDMPDNNVHCVVTSPPYWGLRQYAENDSELGYEGSPEEWTANLVEIYRELRRVLRKDGTFWLNVGDGYVGGNNSDKGGVEEKFHARLYEEVVRATDGKSQWKGLPR